MRSLSNMAAMMALASIGSIARTDYGDVLIVDERQTDDTIRERTRVDRSTNPDKVADAGDLERIRQAAERRARKAQRQARGFVTETPRSGGGEG